MSPRDRDVRTPKTPPESVRAQSAIPDELKHEDSVPVDMPPLERVEYRSRSQSIAIRNLAEDLQPRVRKLEVDIGDCRVGIGRLEGKVDTLVEAAAHDRAARDARAEAAALELATKDQRKLEREKARIDGRRVVALALIGIIVPTLTAIAALVAGMR